MVRLIPFLSLYFFLYSYVSWAQTTTATMLGRVKDLNGAEFVAQSRFLTLRLLKPVVRKAADPENQACANIKDYRDFELLRTKHPLAWQRLIHHPSSNRLPLQI